MKRVERVKIFTGANTQKLEKLYATWYDAVIKERSEIPALTGNEFKIFDRRMVIRNYNGDETFALAIFFEEVLVEEHEKGGDRGQHLKGGVSMVGKRG